MIEIFIYILLGLFVGVIGGLFGIGGGFVIVPVLVALLEVHNVSAAISVHLAIGTSLATIVVTSIASTRAHHLRGAVQWNVFRELVSGIVIGALAGAVIVYFLPTPALRMVFGIFELVVAVQVGFNLMASPHRQLPDQPLINIIGIVIGALSSLAGIGGGVLTVPFLVWCNVSMRQAVATSSACGVPLSAAGAIGFMIMGWNEPALPSGSTGYVYWPAFAGIAFASVVSAPLGAKLAHTLPVDILRRVFACFLVILGIRMLIS